MGFNSGFKGLSQEYTHTRKILNSFCFSRQKFLRERASLFHCTYFGCLVMKLLFITKTADVIHVGRQSCLFVGMSYLAFTHLVLKVNRQRTKVTLNFIKFTNKGETHKFFTAFPFYFILWATLHPITWTYLLKQCLATWKSLSPWGLQDSFKLSLKMQIAWNLHNGPLPCHIRILS